jgi:tellurite resistance protein TehA-like permease
MLASLAIATQVAMTAVLTVMGTLALASLWLALPVPLRYARAVGAAMASLRAE